LSPNGLFSRDGLLANGLSLCGLSPYDFSPKGFLLYERSPEGLSSAPADRPKLFGLLFSEEKFDPDLSSDFLKPLLNDFFESSENNFFFVWFVLSVRSDLKELLFADEPEVRFDFSDLSSRLFLLFLNGMINF
jgi:hypothetical protein